MEPKTYDAAAARAAFDRAVALPNQDFGSFFLSRLYGFQASYAGETCEIAFEVADFMFNPQGSLHGGVVATALDVAMGHLLHHFRGAGTTLELKVQFLEAIRIGPMRCVASFTRAGRSIVFIRAEAFQGDNLVAFATSTWKMLKVSA